MLKITKKKKFLDDGVRFECQGSGNCCSSRGSYGFVYVTLTDRKRFAKFFKLSLPKFNQTYCDKKDGYFILKNLPKSITEDCIFLKDNRCTAYAARPEQCRTWPFWPENMNAKVWNKEIASFCPGVGKGKLYQSEEINSILKSQSP